MRVLFFMRSTVYVRNFESTLRLLAERGHDVHVVADPHQVLDPTDLIGRLCREYSSVTHGVSPRLTGRWSRLGFELRRALDYLRYLEPDYRNAPKLRQRAEEKAPEFVRALLARGYGDTPLRRRLLARALRSADRSLPREPEVDAFVRGHRPDIVLVTPLVEPGSPQSDYVRSARALGVPTALCVYSWDNLTNKGLIHEPLDLVTVWNRAMRDEAVSLHRVPPERVVVTGAPAYDHWFTWTARDTREAFCVRVGLSPQHPYLLYLCSSKFIAPDEPAFVRRWLTDIRTASPTLRDVGVLIRPHPQNAERWRDLAVTDVPNVAIWPRAGRNPVDADSRSDYFDSIHHSAAVVGVNTSAQIESAIVGRGVYTLLAPEFRDTQEGTLHFRHLREVNGGLLNIASTMDEHVAQLEEALRDPEAAAQRGRNFVAAFVRPNGLSEAATPRLVAAIEAAAVRPRRRYRDPLWAWMMRPALARAAASLADESTPNRAPAPAAPPLGASPAPARQERLRAEKANRKAKLPVGATIGDPGAADPQAAGAFEHYRCVRDHVRRLRDIDAPRDGLTAVEGDVVAALAPLWDADPQTIGTLRRHAAVMTGTRPDDYSGSTAALTTRLEPELRKLLKQDEQGLWVDEPRALGGFGVTAVGRFFNEDTLRQFRAISLLQHAGVLKDFRPGRGRRTVWEIGGAWGGFAAHFRQLCPDVSYLMTGRAESLLVAAVYLKTFFPAARFRFFDPAAPEAFWRDWDAVDFAFAPEAAVPALDPPRLDLVVDLMALERMTAARITLHVERAHAIGCRYFLSLCPSSDPPSELALPVQPTLERWYWPHPVSASAYVSKWLAVRRGRQAGPVKRTYVLGWKRLLA